MEKYNFIGKNLTNEDANAVSKALETRHFEETKKELIDYREPTPEESLNIEKSKKLIEEELKLMGVDVTTFDINSYQFKFLNKSTGKGTYYSETRLIEIENNYKVKLENILKNPTKIIPSLGYFVQKLLTKITQLNKNSKTESNYSTIIHEAIHGKSFHKYELDINKDNSESYKINENTYRNGYLLTKNGQEDYFRGLNEGVVDKTTMDILMKEYKDEPDILNKIRKILYYMESEYFIEMLTIDSIINKIAKSKNKSTEEIWTQFKKGQFTGDMMHLRDIEDVYTPGSLRILATMNPRTRMASIKNLLYYTYFSTRSEFIRKIIENKLLSKNSKDKLKE
ncbi:MAG: hypothetical protein WCW54_00215 [Candidatus Paceibacterota bacterium]